MKEIDLARTDYPSDKMDQYVLRLPNGMRGCIKEIAALNMRSMNAEIIMALKERIERHTNEKAEARS
ncbi:MAG: Arc family DNA-binding protein [Shinella sp.]|uniref:Arc family DNA-binding protein n=1 Tax=Shinella sp. TaxID=1870904 RepID=UPI003C72C425